MRRLGTTAGILLVAAFGVVGFILAKDYLTPAQLQIDLNAPRFRLVRHRSFFANESLEMEWKPSSRWAFPASETPAIFGQRTPGGFYAWELVDIGGYRFEHIFDKDIDGYPIQYEVLRTNYFSFALGTRWLHKVHRPLEPADDWARHHDR
jgi:hypothetical protein